MIGTEPFFVSRRVQIKDSGTVKQHEIAVYLDSNTVILSDPHTGFITNAGIKLDRLEVVPIVKSQKEKEVEKGGYIGGDTFPCTVDEATEWFVFLMLQAGALYDRVPPDARNEVERLLKVRGIDDGPWYVAAMAYYDTALNWYEEDRKND
jgi:hypothetical protein